ncbi:MAG: hypothetical protein PHC33_01640 [Candidatus Omnitrophica bacterium]|nr:hypothetical protein [Candidatus Omnitrophota bacterium]
MGKKTFVFYLVMAVLLLCSKAGFPDSFSDVGNYDVSTVSDSGGVDTYGTSGWQSSGTAMASMESTGESSTEEPITGQSGGAWDNFGWEMQGDGSWTRTSANPSSTTEVQTGDWWTGTVVGYSVDFSIQSPSTTTLADQWSVDSPQVQGTPETNSLGQTRTVTNWDTTTYGKFNTYSGARLDGSMGLTVGNFKNFGEFTVTQTYDTEILTPSGGKTADTSTGKPDGVVDTSGGTSGGTIALSGTTAGSKTITIPEDAADPSAAGESGDFAEQMEAATAATGKPSSIDQQMETSASRTVSRDVAKKQEELTGDGRTGMTVDPHTGNAVSLKELSQDEDYEFDGAANLGKLLFASREAYAAGDKSVVDTRKAEQPAALSLKSYTLTDDELKEISMDTRLLEEVTVANFELDETYTSPQLIDSEQQILGIEPHTSYGEWQSPVTKSGGGSSSSSGNKRYAVHSSDGSFRTTDDRSEAGETAESYASHLPKDSDGNTLGSVSITDTQPH